NDVVQVIDVPAMAVVKDLRPGRAVLHLEFTPRGEQAWISSRDDDAVVVYDTASFAETARLPAARPSGIFLAARGSRTGFCPSSTPPTARASAPGGAASRSAPGRPRKLAP